MIPPAMATEVSSLKKVAEGREAEMFEWGDGRVLRLYRSEYSLAAEGEQRRLDIARRSGLRVPEQFGRHDVNGRAGIILERVAGPDLLTEVSAKPWHVLHVGSTWGKVQAEINRRQAPPELEPARLRARRIIERTEHIPADIREAALTQIESLSDGDRLLHGDCHPANIMRHGDELVVIDWTNVCRGPAEADFYRSYLMCTLGDLPPGTPWLLKTMARFGRRLMRGPFQRSYKKVLTPDPSVIREWQLPTIAARIAEGIEPELPALEKLARKLINDKQGATP